MFKEFYFLKRQVIQRDGGRETWKPPKKMAEKNPEQRVFSSLVKDFQNFGVYLKITVET